MAETPILDERTRPCVGVGEPDGGERALSLAKEVRRPDTEALRLASAAAALFGRMSRTDWGVFVHRHFDYHLRQFGA